MASIDSIVCTLRRFGYYHWLSLSQLLITDIPIFTGVKIMNMSVFSHYRVKSLIPTVGYKNV